MVELFERSHDCWVAAGDSGQWSQTHSKLEALAWSLTDQLQTVSIWNQQGLDADIRKAWRLVKQSWEAIFSADQWGRLSIELFPSEAQMIQQAINA